MMGQFEDYPILLIPGIARFDYLRSKIIERLNVLLDPDIESDLTHYFKGIRSYLRSQGYSVEYGDVAFAEGLEKRADELENSIDDALEKYNQPYVHLLGHSMGGLDARYLVATRPLTTQKVVTVTTLGTPHLGTSFADYALEKGLEDLIKFAAEFELDLSGFQTLTREATVAFNEKIRQAEATNDIIYTTYTSWQKREDVYAPLRITWDIINEAEGMNDGFVSAVSQAWVAEIVADSGQGKKINQREFAIRADHLNQIGRWDWTELDWSSPNIIQQIRDYEKNIKDAYLKIVQEICSMG